MEDYKLVDVELKNGVRVMIIDTRDPENIRKYIDSSIRMWLDRSKSPDTLFSARALCYTDAFQSIRLSLFGEVLE